MIEPTLPDLGVQNVRSVLELFLKNRKLGIVVIFQVKSFTFSFVFLLR